MNDLLFLQNNLGMDPALSAILKHCGSHVDVHLTYHCHELALDSVAASERVPLARLACIVIVFVIGV